MHRNDIRTGPNTTGRTRATLLVTFLVLIIIAQFVLFLAVYHPQHPDCASIPSQPASTKP